MAVGCDFAVSHLTACRDVLRTGTIGASGLASNGFRVRRCADLRTAFFSRRDSVEQVRRVLSDFFGSLTMNCLAVIPPCRWLLLACSSVPLLVSSGCSKEGLVMVPVSGTVTLDGETLVPEGGKGRVIFSPVVSAKDLLAKGDPDNPEAGRMAIGDIQPDGSYTVSTSQPGDGLAIGSYSVAVTLLADSPGVPARAKAGKDGGLPTKYTRAETSGFLFTVMPDDSSRTLDLALESDGTDANAAQKPQRMPPGKNY
jgi:hypothetical protein